MNEKQPEIETPTDKSCLDVIDETVSQTEGIVNVTLDPQSEQLLLDYDPKHVSQADLTRIANQIAPTLKHWETCTMRLEKKGGRACESCAAALERRLTEIPGVRRAAASFVGGALTVTYDNNLISLDDITTNVRSLGAEVRPSAAEPEAQPEPEATGLSWFAGNIEAVFTVITFIAMIGGLIAENSGAAAWLIWGLYGVAFFTGGIFGLKAGLESLLARTVDVDLLMVLAAVGAAIVGEPFEGVLLLFLFSLSNVLQDFAMDRTRNAIRALMKLRPNEATIVRGQQRVVLPIDKVTIGDLMIVKPGERIPLDGRIVSGSSTVDQSPITGESLPVPKNEGNDVLAGTINQSGHLEVRVTRLAKDSTIAKLIKMVEEAQSEKAKTQRFLDTAEQYYALGVIIFTILAIIIPTQFLGEAFQPAFYRAMSIMVAASPCALIISTPASILSAIGNGARRGILFKGGAYVEQAAEIKVIAFDKTGTLTQGKPEVTDVITCPEWTGSKDELLLLAASLEDKSEHVLAQAVVKASQAHHLDLQPVTQFRADAGQGVQGTVNGRILRIGAPHYFEGRETHGLEDALIHVTRMQNEGKTSVLIAQMDKDGWHILGVIGLADTLRHNAAAVVADLKQLGIQKVVMLTGDNARTAKTIAEQVGVDEYYADLLPEDKMTILRQLKEQYGSVAMVGDGVNDAPALALATIGIAMGAAGTDVALETADLVLMSDELEKIPYAMALSRQTRKTLLVNLGFAAAMIVIMIAAIFAVSMPLPLAVVGHEGGTVLVSLNGLRLLGYNR